MEVQQEPPSKRRDTTKTVACTECRVRKVRHRLCVPPRTWYLTGIPTLTQTKCNRELPCESCIKRGRPQDCTPELRRYPTSVASLQGVINSLQDRVVHLESRLAALESAVGHSTSPHVSISDSRNSTGFVVPQETLGGFGASESFVTSLACHTNSTDSTKGYDRASDAPGSANASELSSFVSGKAVLKDFNILEAAKRRAAAESMPRFASSASSYPSIRDAKGVPPNSWRNSVLLALHASLPSLDVMRARVELFQDYCSWSKPAINCAQLKAELDELENLLQQGLFLQVDPAWIALLFQVLAQGTMQAYVCEDGPGNHLYDFAYSMAEASEGAMAAASWADKPSIRIVQALLLRASWLQYIDPDSGLLLQGSKQQEIILNAALAHAQALGLNKLGDDPAIMPEPDLAFPPHPCEFRRQMALRVWLNIKECFVLAGIKVDWSTSDSPDFNICRGEQYTTASARISFH